MGHQFPEASNLEAGLAVDGTGYEVPLSDDAIVAYDAATPAELAGSPVARLRAYLIAGAGIAAFCYLAPALYEAERLNEEARLQAVVVQQQQAIDEHVRWTLHVRSVHQQSGAQVASKDAHTIRIRSVEQQESR